MKKGYSEAILEGLVVELRDVRRGKRISHESLAKTAGVSRAAISHIESGRRRPSLLMCLKVAEALGVPFSELVNKVEKEIDK